MFKPKHIFITAVLLLVGLFVSYLLIDLTEKRSEASLNSYSDPLFDEKVAELQDVIDRFNPEDVSFSPKSINEFTRSCDGLLKEILRTSGSASCGVSDILKNEDTFYLRFNDSLKIGDTSYRFIEFGNQNLLDGGMIFLYIQGLNESDNTVSLKGLHEIFQTASSTGEFSSYELVNKDDEYLISVLASFEGIESDYTKTFEFKMDDIEN